jgi:hypothetical protein
MLFMVCSLSSRRTGVLAGPFYERSVKLRMLKVA